MPIALQKTIGLLLLLATLGWVSLRALWFVF